MTERKLLELKKEIQKTKIQLSEVQGQEKMLKEQLHEMGCSSVKEAKLLISELQKEIEEIEEDILKNTNILENDYL